MQLRTLEALYIEQLRDLYSAESQIIRSLPKLAEAASDEKLKAAFQKHLEVTTQQKERLEQIFEGLDRPATGKHCKGMEGILKEGEELIKEKDNKADPEVLDAALLASAQHVEHYEMAGYGTVATWAEQLGFTDAASLLKQSLGEEEQTDKELTELAESRVNRQAES